MTLKELEALYKSVDELRSDGIKFKDPGVVAMCDRRLDKIQDRIIDAKAKAKKG